MISDFDAAVLIVNYRTPELVERCLASVRATSGTLRLETVVVDNSCQAGSAETLRAALPQTQVVEMPSNGGFAAGVNAGFANSSAELVVVLNPDTEVTQGALQTLLAHLREHPGTGVVAPLLEHADGRPAPNGYRRFPSLWRVALDLCIPLGYLLVYAPRLNPYPLPPAALARGARPAWVSGAAMAIRRSAYMQAGPLDERFFLYFEETEWQQRVAHSGWAIEVAPSARVRHLLRGGGEQALAHSPHFLAGALRYLGIQGVSQRRARAVLALSLLCSWMALWLIACLPSKRGHAAGQARAYGLLLRLALSGGGAARE
jgi:N-acetylglucosaminyl-diphospho-decaprenol L-rhamnosyltransferase